MSQVSSPPFPALFVAAALVAGSAVAAQNYEISNLPRTSSGHVEMYVLHAGDRVVFTSSPFLVAKLWSLPIDLSAPPTLLHDEATQGAVVDIQTTPDGAWTLFRVATNRVRLRAIPTDGSAPGHHVNVDLGAGGGVSDLQLSPDSTHVVFRADAVTDEVYELWSRRIDASAPGVRLSGDLVEGGDVTTDYRISPDGEWVVYRADQDADDVFDLYAVPLDGSEPARRLNATRPLTDVQDDFAIAFDSEGVVYRADQDTDDVFELYGVRIDGLFGSFKRSGPMVAGGDVLDFRLSVVDDRLVYRADQAVNDKYELYGVRAIAGGTPVPLSGALPEAGDVLDCLLARDGERVFYRGDPDTDNITELLSAPTDGSAPPVKLHPPLPPGRGVSLYEPSLDGQHVFFTVDLVRRGAKDLYRAPRDGGPAPLRLTAFDPGIEVRSIYLDHTGSRVAYLADPDANGIPELFSVPVDGSEAPAHLNRGVRTGGRVLEAHVTAEDEVIYAADQRTGFGLELFRVPLSGAAAPVLLTPPFPPGAPFGDVREFALDPEGLEVLYATDSGVNDLWRVPLGGRAPQVRVSGPGGDETLRARSPDGRFAVFQRPSWAPSSDDVISRRVDGSAPLVWLDRDVPLVASVSQLYDVVVTPDSSRALFTLSQEIAVEMSLYSASLDGSQPVARLDSYLDTRDFLVSPDSTRVVYLRSAPGAPSELFSAPTDGSQPPIRLSAPLPAGGSIGNSAYRPSFSITPDGLRVVYVGEQDVAGVLELYSAPIDGSTAPWKLNGTLVAGGEVRADPFYGEPFHVSPDGAWVLYVADQDTDEVFELYRAPVLGGAAPVKLSGTLVAGGTVGGAFENSSYLHTSLRVSPNGHWVVYMADATTDQHTELFVVPLDGSAPPRKLSAPLPADADVYDFRVDPTSRRAVYRSIGPGYFLYDLHSTPLDGAAPAVLLTRRVEPASFARSYDVTPDGTRVVFAARLDDENTVELYLRAIDASGPPRKLSGPMVAGGDLYTSSGTWFLITPDGNQVLYRADQDRNDVDELFATCLDHRPRGADAPGRTVFR